MVAMLSGKLVPDLKRLWSELDNLDLLDCQLTCSSRLEHDCGGKARWFVIWKVLSLFVVSTL